MKKAQGPYKSPSDNENSPEVSSMSKAITNLCKFHHRAI